jgi:multiple antibiotic resistance protein
VTGRLFGSVLVTMLVIMDPPGAIPIFLAVTGHLTQAERRRAATMAVATAFLVIVSFALGGQQVLRYLHVSIPALQGAGGLLLLLVALQLLQGDDDEESATPRPEQRTSIAMVPLGTPVLAGPGAIVAVIVFTRQADGVSQYAALAAALVCVHIVLWLALRYSGVVLRIIRPTGVLLVTRVAGMLLAAIAVQMVADSVRAFVHDG